MPKEEGLHKHFLIFVAHHHSISSRKNGTDRVIYLYGKDEDRRYTNDAAAPGY
jgi:hypothetical protein